MTRMLPQDVRAHTRMHRGRLIHIRRYDRNVPITWDTRPKAAKRRKSRRSVYHEPKSKRIDIDIDTPANARIKCKHLLTLYAKATTDEERMRIERACDLGAKRADGSSHRKNISAKERKEMKDVARIYNSHLSAIRAERRLRERTIGIIPKQRPTKISISEAKSRPWEFSRSQYLAVMDAPSTGIMLDVSPTQMSRMSKAAKRRYEKRKEGEHKVRSKLSDEWKQGIIKAYENGDIKKSDLSKNSGGMLDYSASDVIHDYERLKETGAKEKTRVDDKKMRKVKSASEIKVGDKIKGGASGRIGVVVKVNKKTLKVEYPNVDYLKGQFTTQIRFAEWPEGTDHTFIEKRRSEKSKPVVTKTAKKTTLVQKGKPTGNDDLMQRLQSQKHLHLKGMKGVEEIKKGVFLIKGRFKSYAKVHVDTNDNTVQVQYRGEDKMVYSPVLQGELFPPPQTQKPVTKSKSQKTTSCQCPWCTDPSRRNYKHMNEDYAKVCPEQRAYMHALTN